MLNLRQIIGLIAAASVADGAGFRRDGLRVKFGWSSALENVDYFFKIPRTLMEAEAEGWRRTNREGLMAELRMYCTPGRNVCPMYDVGGFIAGLQIGFPKDDFESQVQKPQAKMMSWRALANFGEPTKDFWHLPQYYVTEESLKAGSGPQIENGATLQEGGVWVYGPDVKLMRIPTTEAELNNTIFKKQNCIPNMGTHYYYNLTKDTKCEDIWPWFALVSEGELIGTGFFMFGRLVKQSDFRKWFENGPFTKESVKLTVPDAPKCLYDWAEYGILSLHIYYVDKPWNIRCKDGDSLKQSPVMDRLLFNGYRYAKAISDNVKKMFGG
ncbi:uncharacterized protein LOC113226571 isoform X2 [Hyposmocoma kahamanoa]|uniref:uncharacterized protein LOC113226571 isoform X2 n=1 Tax=Hyposmocoma kahamanoa TaxID=1477025 RepID=UPI000E6D6A15|nr:uncharacterized protein LOC113226571 isoform X2 [Hyposmocoma kahamanoa]